MLCLLGVMLLSHTLAETKVTLTVWLDGLLSPIPGAPLTPHTSNKPASSTCTAAASKQQAELCKGSKNISAKTGCRILLAWSHLQELILGMSTEWDLTISHASSHRP